MNKKLLLYLIFTFSGLSGLIYETIWSRYLGLFLGHAAYSQTLVLVIYMGGMAIGAYLAARFDTRIKNRLRLYGCTEAVIGAAALAFHSIFLLMTGLAYSQIFPAVHSETVLMLLKILLAAIIILPQSILLGSTFPLMSAGIIRRYPAEPGNTLAILYFTNSLGGFAGALASGFILVEYLGLPGTVIAAGIVNLLIFGAITLLAKDSEPSETLSAGNSGTSQPAVESGKLIFYGLLLVAAATGASSFLYEIGWIRMLALVMGSTSHSFELMLAAFILGIAIGGIIIRRRIDSSAHPLRLLAFVQIAMGTLAIATLIAYNQSYNFIKFTDEILPKTDTGYLLFNLLGIGLSLAIMLPAAICAGMTLPLISGIMLRNGMGESSIGKVYSANTIGAIAGVVIGFNFIMPGLGLKNVIISGGAVDIAIGIIILFIINKELKRFQSIKFLAGGIAFVAAFILFLQLDELKMATCMFGKTAQPVSKELVYHKDGKTATVDVVRFRSAGIDGIGISTNGNPLGNLSLTPGKIFHEHNAILLAAIPLSINDNIKTAATFGMGTGMTASAILAHPDIESLDVIEIEQAVIDGALNFGRRVEDIYSDERCRVINEDARSFFANQTKKYDLVISDPTQPWVSGIANLYSKEFYSIIHSSLNSGGIFVQWILTSGLSSDLILGVLKSISSNFKDYAIYNVNDSFIMIIASDKYIGEPKQRIFQMPKLKNMLAQISIFNAGDIMLHRMFGSALLNPLIGSLDITGNSDFYPELDNKAQKTFFLNKNANDLLELRTFAAPLTETLERVRYPRGFTMTGGDYTRYSYYAKQAKLIASSFELREESGMIQSMMDAKTKAVLENFNYLSWRGRLGAEEESALLGYLGAIMQMTLPWLSKEDLAVIWGQIAIAPAYRGLSPQAREWSDLYEAVCLRNWSRLFQLTQTKLGAGNLSGIETNYLYNLNLLSQIAGQIRNGELAKRYAYLKHNNKITGILLQILNKDSVNRKNSDRK